MARPHLSRSAASPRSGPSDVLVVLVAWLMLWLTGLFGDAASSRAPAEPIAAAAAEAMPPQPASAPVPSKPDGRRSNGRSDDDDDDERRSGLEDGGERLLAAAADASSESDPDTDGHFAGEPAALGLLATASTVRDVPRPRPHESGAHAAPRAPPTTAAPVA
jgi:hypothetical protein